MATSKSWLMPIESSPSIEGSTPRAASSSLQRPERPEVRTRLLRVVHGGRQQHQPGEPDGAEAGRGLKSAGSSSARAPCLVGFARQVDLDQQLDRASGG